MQQITKDLGYNNGTVPAYVFDTKVGKVTLWFAGEKQVNVEGQVRINGIDYDMDVRFTWEGPISNLTDGTWLTHVYTKRTGWQWSLSKPWDDGRPTDKARQAMTELGRSLILQVLAEHPQAPLHGRFRDLKFAIKLSTDKLVRLQEQVDKEQKVQNGLLEQMKELVGEMSEGDAK